MQALVSNHTGSVQMQEVDEPQPSSDEAVVEVAAFSVNRGETFQLDNPPPPPWRPGKDVAGVIVAQAADGTGPVVGTRVVGHPPLAGWAERVAVPTTVLAVVPDNVDLETVAALPLAGLTALRLLRQAGSLIGQRLLVTGASGGVGHYLTEMAVSSGAEVTAVAASPQRGQRLTALGATVVHTVDEAEGRYDVVFESVGGPSFWSARRKAKRTGNVIWFGQASREPITVDFFDWIDGTAGAPITPFHYVHSDRPDADDLHTLVSLLARGRLHPEIGLRRPWRETADVIAMLRDRKLRGNAVLTLSTT